MFEHRSKLVQKTISYLPFSDRNLTDINISSDFFEFLEAYGLYYLDNPIEEFQKFIDEYELSEFSDYQTCRLIGCLKHAFAIHWVVNFNPDETGSLALPFLSELQNDICYAVLLARYNQYKLSGQIMRNALELIVMHSYFLSLGKRYDDIDKVSVPPMRKNKRGMLLQLIKTRIVDENEGAKIGKMYGFLSSATHNHWRFLDCSFEQDSYSFWEWSENLISVLSLILTILLRLYNRYPEFGIKPLITNN